MITCIVMAAMLTGCVTGVPIPVHTVLLGEVVAPCRLFRDARPEVAPGGFTQSMSRGRAARHRPAGAIGD
jgi:hypothetical protein